MTDSERELVNILANCAGVLSVFHDNLPQGELKTKVNKYLELARSALIKRVGPPPQGHSQHREIQ